MAALSRLARTVRVWEAEILAFHGTAGCSNGPTEAVNLLIKKVRRVGHGFGNFTNYRPAAAAVVRRHLADPRDRKPASPLTLLVT